MHGDLLLSDMLLCFLGAVLTIFCFCMKVARCTKIISPNTDDAKYVINVKQIAKVWHDFIVSN